MRFIGFSNKDFPVIPRALSMPEGHGKFILLLNDRLQPAHEGVLLAGDIDRHALLLALYRGLTSDLRADLTVEEVEKKVLQPIYALVGRSLVPAAGRYYFSTKHACHVGWGSAGWGIHHAPSVPNLAEVVKEVLTEGLENEPKLWAKTE